MDDRPGNDDLATLRAPVDAAELASLHRRLERAAQADGLLDVAYRVLDSPVGDLLLAATPGGLVRIAFANEGHDEVLESLASTLSPRILHAPGRLDVAACELDEYFERRRQVFDLDLDRSLSKGFRALVQRRLPEIAYGRTRTYGEVAEIVGNPRAVRAVGSACATNPLPIVVPCHRVVRADGSLGGYIGGLDAKARLLELEAA
ncbi:MAG: methylated-DNA--[protein]-cysteine S-methyltransferase [Actinobacteria bacterium]|nr:methylated-DNA--[protein]-cysteine S-methyltransferase [Actinomycetota bacterium]